MTFDHPSSSEEGPGGGAKWSATFLSSRNREEGRDQANKKRPGSLTDPGLFFMPSGASADYSAGSLAALASL
jgi:hypothetical protein